jgi:hypothetical protein
MSEREELVARFQETYPECCGEVDKGGTCCAPACTRGDVLKALSRLPKGNGELVEAVRGFVRIIDSAGLRNLANGVQLGQVSWLVKATDSLEFLRKALSALPNGEPNVDVNRLTATTPIPTPPAQDTQRSDSEATNGDHYDEG